MDFCNKPEFWRYVKSLKNTTADHYILTCEMNVSQRSKLMDLGCVVVDVHLNHSSNFFIMRNAAYNKFLLNLSEYNYIAITDAKDVIFQRDVFELANNGTYITTEGFLHKDSPWNTTDQANFHSSVKPDYKDQVKLPVDLSEKLVLNGGIILGDPAELYNITYLLSNIGIYCNNVDSFTDQAVLNHYYYTNRFKCRISDPKVDNICITGEAIKEGFMDEHFLYRFTDNKFLTKDGEPYFLVHQWDRTKYKDEILND